MRCGLPSFLPFALSFRRPARALLTMRLRSSSATAPRTVKTMRPAGVALSSDSDRWQLGHSATLMRKTVKLR
jgi:hypothetical protein